MMIYQLLVSTMDKKQNDPVFRLRYKTDLSSYIIVDDGINVFTAYIEPYLKYIVPEFVIKWIRYIALAVFFTEKNEFYAGPIPQGEETDEINI